jgi:HK97 gp10 family phage protein
MKIANRDRFIRRLKALPPAVKSEMSKALQRSADEITAMQKRLAPRKSGTLASTIANEAKPDSDGLVIGMFAGGPKTTKTVTDKRGVAAYDYDYAFAAEFGTKKHKNEGKFEGSMNPGATAHPFFFPAYRFGKKRARQRLGRAYGKAARKAAGS